MQADQLQAPVSPSLLTPLQVWLLQCLLIILRLRHISRRWHPWPSWPGSCCPHILLLWCCTTSTCLQQVRLSLSSPWLHTTCTGWQFCASRPSLGIRTSRELSRAPPLLPELAEALCVVIKTSTYSLQNILHTYYAIFTPLALPLNCKGKNFIPESRGPAQWCQVLRKHCMNSRKLQQIWCPCNSSNSFIIFT